MTLTFGIKQGTACSVGLLCCDKRRRSPPHLEVGTGKMYRYMDVSENTAPHSMDAILLFRRCSSSPDSDVPNFVVVGSATGLTHTLSEL
jgi:hypothetical protein